MVVAFSYAQALELVGTAVPGHLQADLEVPSLRGVQAQGDLLVFPIAEPDDVAWAPVPATGVQLIRSEATGNTHWLHQDQGSTGVQWAEPVRVPVFEEEEPDLRLAYVRVPEGQVGLLIHTEEHGVNGIGPGTYQVNRKREADPESVQRLLAD